MPSVFLIHGDTPPAPSRHVGVVLLYVTQDAIPEILARVLDALRQHGDAGYELTAVTTFEYLETDDVTIIAAPPSPPPPPEEHHAT